ncbi:MAG: family 20 glycosylhydrolase [Bacteroidales bacterium]
MKHLFKLQILIIAAIAAFIMLTQSCNSGNKPNENLQIKWSLIENKWGDPSECTAEFTFINTGSADIDGADWIMYFNQTTIDPKTMKDTTLGKVEHINGDFYRFVPGQNFNIAAGDSLKFEYTYDGVMIKYGDAPAGLYIVLNETKGKPQIVEIKNYTINPFTDLSKVFPDSSYFTTPASEFYKNQYITKLEPENKGKILPTPFQVKPGNGKAILNESVAVYYAKGLENEAAFVSGFAQSLTGNKLPVYEGTEEGPNHIVLKTGAIKVNGVSAEAYNLKIDKKKGIAITGSDAAGVFYGIQSLISLLPKGLFNKSVSDVEIAAVEINDAPRFAYRGFLLDVSRNFQKKEAVLKLIDVLSFYKINLLNLRITEDEAWRLEIKGLPELTQMGSKRGHTLFSDTCLTPSFGSGPFTTNPQGTGYYSREDFKEIIKYAALHHVEVIPEICFPSHARAAIKAMEARYRYYMSKNDEKAAEEFRLIDPEDKSVYSSAQRYNDNIVCVANESAYHFYETVIKDIIAMYDEAGFKLTTFNTGGDEVPNGAWAKSPRCIELMKTLPEVKNPRQLQGYFLRKALGILSKYNLKVTGWEEVVLNKDSENNIAINNEFVGKNVMPLVWDNTGSNIDLGYRIANAGYPVVLCNVTNLYFDLSYNTDPEERGLYWGGFQDAIDPYLVCPYDVYKSTFFNDLGYFTDKAEAFAGKDRLKPENRKNIIGLQAQLWTETVKGQDMMEYYVLPKLFAFAEKAWSAAPAWENEASLNNRIAKIQSGWNELANRIGQRELPKLDVLFGGFKYRIPLPGAVVENGMVKANIAFPGLTIRYTYDGSEPTINSPVYEKPIDKIKTVKLKAFNQFGRESRTVIIQ